MKLIVNGIEATLEKEIPFPLNYSIADVKNPEKRKRSGSLTVTLPGDRNNLNIFYTAYALSITDLGAGTGFQFDPTVRVEAQVYEGGNLLFDGLLQLFQVKIEKGKYSFEVGLYSNYVDWFKELGDLTVGGLGWSEYDHTLNQTNIENSWDTSVVVNSTPTSNFTTGVPDGFGYVYPHIDWGYADDLTTLSTTDIVPLLYVKEVLEKCAEVADLTITGNWINEEKIKRLLVSWGGGEKNRLSQAEIDAREVDYDNALDYSESVSHNQGPFYFGNPNGTPEYRYGGPPQPVWGDISTFTLTDDDIGQFNTTIGRVTVAQSGKYRITFSGTIRARAPFSTTPTSTITHDPKLTILLKRNGASLPGSSVTIPASTTASYTSTAINITGELDLLAGDEIRVAFFPQTLNSAITWNGNPTDVPTIDFDFDTTTDARFLMEAIETPITDGDTVELARFAPNMKCSDFVKGIVRAFNLYVGDPTEEGEIKIEPLEDFYQDTDDAIDVTELVDHNKPIVIKPASSIEGKLYEYKWSASGDYWTTRYVEEYGRGYGDYTYEVPSTFQTGVRKFELPFSQTIPVTVPNSEIISPRVVRIDNSTGAKSPFKGKPRLFIYNGVVSLSSGTFTLTDDDGTNGTSHNDYPNANHLMDLTNADFDLNWTLPEEIYFEPTAYTNNNLWTGYERFVRETTGRDSKIVTLFLKVDAEWMYDFTFDQLLMINGVVYRVNEIKEFDPEANDTTMFELVRVVEADSAEALSYSGNEIQPQDPTRGGGQQFGEQSGNFTINPDVRFTNVNSSGAGVVATLNAGTEVGQKISFRTDGGSLDIAPSGTTLNGAGSTLKYSSGSTVTLLYTPDGWYEIAK